MEPAVELARATAHIGDFSSGYPDDIAYANNAATRALFDEFGVRYSFSEFAAGGHTWQTWYHDLRDFAPRLFG